MTIRHLGYVKTDLSVTLECLHCCLDGAETEVLSVIKSKCFVGY